MSSQEYVEVLVEPLKSKNTALTATITNADHFFDHMDSLRNTVLQMIIKDRGTFLLKLLYQQSFLPMDLRCRVRMGHVLSITDRLERGATPPTQDLYQKCRSCDAMDLLSPLGDIRTGKPFYPTYGRMKDTRMVVLKKSDVVPKITKITSLGDIISRIIRADELSVGCQPSLPLLSQTEYYALDEFTNFVLTNWYISYLLSRENAVRKLYYPFICSNNGYLLMESKDYINLLDYKITHVYQTWGLLFQLFSTLDKLKHNQLSFQEITDQTFLLEKARCEYSYNGVNVIDDYTLVMNDFSKVGVNINADKSSNSKHLRMFRRHQVADDFFIRVSNRVISWSRHYSLADVPGEKPRSWITYHIAPPEKDIHDYGLLIEKHSRRNTDVDLEAFLHANRMGIPMYQGSFDAYRIMLLLCTNEGFYHSLIRNRELNMLWRSFWAPLEYNIINERIRAHHELKDEKYPYTRMLVGLNLRCNLITHIWTQLKHYAKTEHRSTRQITLDTDVIVQSP